MNTRTPKTTTLAEQEENTCIDIFRSIMRAHHLMHRRASRVAAAAGLQAAELNVIDILGKFGPVSMGRLAREAFISPSNTTSTVKKLEHAGLVKRKRADHSGRVVTVSLTVKGRAKFRKNYPVVLASVQQHIAERLTRREMAGLAEMLRKFTA